MTIMHPTSLSPLMSTQQIQTTAECPLLEKTKISPSRSEANHRYHSIINNSNNDNNDSSSSSSSDNTNDGNNRSKEENIATELNSLENNKEPSELKRQKMTMNDHKNNYVSIITGSCENDKPDDRNNSVTFYSNNSGGGSGGGGGGGEKSNDFGCISSKIDNDCTTFDKMNISADGNDCVVSNSSSISSSNSSNSSNDNSSDDDDNSADAVNTISRYIKRQTTFCMRYILSKSSIHDNEITDTAIIEICSCNNNQFSEEQLRRLIDTRLRYEFSRIVLDNRSTTNVDAASISDIDILTFIRSLPPSLLPKHTTYVRFFSVSVHSKRSFAELNRDDKNAVDWDSDNNHLLSLLSFDITLRRHECSIDQFQQLVNNIIQMLQTDLRAKHCTIKSINKILASYEKITHRLMKTKLFIFHEITNDNIINLWFNETTGEVQITRIKTNEVTMPVQKLFDTFHNFLSL